MTHSMKYNTQSCRLVCKKELQPGIYDFTVESREFASKAQPGQFAIFWCRGRLSGGRFLFVTPTRKKELCGWSFK